MNEPKIDHDLIKHILALLDIPEYEHMDTNIKQANSTTSLDPYQIMTARQVIKFMDEMPGGFFIYHADDNEEIIYANKAILRIFQCDTLEEFQELTGNSFKGLVHPDDLEMVEESIKKQIASSQYDLDYIEYRIICKDGSIRWIEDYGHFIHNDSVGDIFYVFAGDATEKRKRMLSEKTKNEQKLQSLMKAYDHERKLINQEHLQRMEVIEGLSVNYDSILYADLDRDKILPYRLSSRTKQQFSQRFQVRFFSWYVTDYVNVWVHPEDRAMVSKVTDPAYIRRKLSENKTYYINYRVISGEKIQYLQLRLVNVGSSQDHISQIVMGYRRVDEEIRREMEQKQILEEALHNAKLAITAKNTFLSNMSHDMRTPLNAIFGFLDLAKKHIDDKETLHNYLDKIDASSKQLLNLIDKVLEISWTETDDVRILETECNLAEILQNVQNSLDSQAAEKNIAFSLDATGLKHCNIYSDQDKLRQLLLYLTNNAITYTNIDGKVDLIATELEESPNNYVTCQFIVKDTGIGISKDFLQHIYEPFEREKNTTFSGIHGTGLGLTIAKNIVEMLGGDIKIDSAVGKGSVFTVTLRFRKQLHALPAPSDAGAATVSLQNKKILLVEDNEINLEIETEILEDLGFLIDTAEDGSIAVEKMRNATPGDYDLILMDIQMPVMDGRQAAKAIRKLENPELANIPILALSADAFESDKRMSIECGMDAHLTKPIDVPQLLDAITKTLQERSARKEPNHL